MGFLKSIGMWLLKILLSGIGVKIRTEAQAQAEKEREQALAREQAAKDNAQLEKGVSSSIAEEALKARVERKNRPIDDPFGNKAWNAEASPEEPKK